MKVFPLPRVWPVLCAALAVGGLAEFGCASGKPAGGPPASAGPLHDRLGGKAAIEAVVDELLARVARDSRINARFVGVDPARLRMMLVDQICSATGGPCQYLGRDMRSAHAGLFITEAEFNALVENLQGALTHFKVGQREQGELLAVLGPLKPDIVGLDGAAADKPGAKANAPNAPDSGAGAVAERAQGLREAAGLLEKAGEARRRGNLSLAEQLFSSAEILTGPEPLAALAPVFRQGAPPRVNARTVKATASSTAQPRAAGSSEDDENVSGGAARPGRATLTGAVSLQGGAAGDQLAVVTLESLDGRGRRRTARHRVIEQRNREFAPRVLVVPVGSTVGFPNFDSIYHNVFSRSETQPFDLGLYKGGESREIKIEREGILRVGCNLHANMRAYVVAVAAPHYVVTGPDGRFTLRGIEPGRYRLRAYHERSDQPATQELVIVRGANSVTLSLAATVPEGPMADKFGKSRGASVQRR